jgi:hypothetical protein
LQISPDQTKQVQAHQPQRHGARKWLFISSQCDAAPCTQRLAWQIAAIGPKDYLGANLESSRHHPITKIGRKWFCTHFAGWLANRAHVLQLKLQETRDSGVTGSIHLVRVKRKSAAELDPRASGGHHSVKEILTNLLIFCGCPADPESRR